MADVIVVYWRDIPAQVTVKAGRRTARVPLSERFETAIDRAAMKAKLHDSESYLAEWRRGAPDDCGDDVEAAAAAAAAALEADYDDDRLRRLVRAGGQEEASA